MFAKTMNLVRNPLLENGEVNIDWLNVVSGAYAKPMYLMLLDGWEPMHPDNVPVELEDLCTKADVAGVVTFILKLYAFNQTDVPKEVLDILECSRAVIPFAQELVLDFREIIQEECECLMAESQ